MNLRQSVQVYTDDQKLIGVDLGPPVPEVADMTIKKGLHVSFKVMVTGGHQMSLR